MEPFAVVMFVGWGLFCAGYWFVGAWRVSNVVVYQDVWRRAARRLQFHVSESKPRVRGVLDLRDVPVVLVAWRRSQTLEVRVRRGGDLVVTLAPIASFERIDAWALAVLVESLELPLPRSAGNDAEIAVIEAVLTARLTYVPDDDARVDDVLQAMSRLASALDVDTLLDRLVAMAGDDGAPGVARAAALVACADAGVPGERIASAARAALGSTEATVTLAGAFALLAASPTEFDDGSRLRAYDALAHPLVTEALSERVIPLLVDDVRGRGHELHAALLHALRVAASQTESRAWRRAVAPRTREIEAALQSGGAGQLALAADAVAEEGALSVVGDGERGAAVRLVSRDSGGNPDGDGRG